MNYSEELEKKIIGNLLLDEDLNHLELDEEYFYFPEMKEIFNEIVICKAERTPLETIFLHKEHYYDLLSNCTDVGVLTTNYFYNCENLKRLYVSREVSILGVEMSNVDYKNIEKTIDTIKVELNKLSDISNHNDIKIINSEQIEFNYGGKKGYVPTGFNTIDECLNDLEPGRVTLVTGPSFAGKTTFVRQVIANAVNTSNKTLWIMGENEVKDEMRRLFEIVIGRKKGSYDIVKDNKRFLKIPKQNVLSALRKWCSGKLRILHKAEAKLKSHNEMFELLESELKNKAHNLIVVDNLMSVLSATSFEKNEAQADFMQRCCDLSKVYNTHIVLVLHPRKNSNTKLCENDDISGSSDIPNKADNIIWVTKSTEEEKFDGIDGWIHVKKNKKWGDVVSIKTMFDRETNSLNELIDNKAVIKSFDIEKYIDTTIVFNDGSTQTFTNGEFEPF